MLIKKLVEIKIKDLIHGKILYFSHSIVFKDKTGIVPSPNCDVIMVAPKNSSTIVRTPFFSS